MARFYGWTDEYIGKMPLAKAKLYYEAIDTITHEEMLFDLTVNDYPHMKKEGRKKVYNAVKKAVNKHIPKEQVTASELSKTISGMMNGK